MAFLYAIHLSNHKTGFGKPSVRCLLSETGLSGHLNPETKSIVKADESEIREALPHYYRKAFDRALKWYPKEGGMMPGHAALYDSRGRYLNTVYFQPYHFNP